MNEHLLAAAVHGIPTLVWGILAVDVWRYRRQQRPASTLFRLLPLVAVANVVHYGAHALIELTPTELDGRVAGLHTYLEAVVQVCVVATVALLRHLVVFLPVPEEPPPTRWLVVHYGIATVAAALAIVPLVFPWLAVGHRWLDPDVIAGVYTVVVGTLAVRDMRRFVRRGTWRPGAYDVRSPDLAVFATVILVAMVMLVAMRAPTGVWSSATLFLHTALAVGLAIPFAVRMLGEMVRALISATVLLAATGATLFAYTVTIRGASAEARHLLGVGAVLVLVALLGPGQTALRAWIDRAVFRRSHRRRAELQAFVHSLSPELGAIECCRRALAELVRTMQVPGAAILLAGDGGTLVHGAFRLEPLEQVWPTGAGADPVPGPGFVPATELPLPFRRGALDAEVSWVMAITSPRRLWGHLFAAEGFMTAPLTTDDVDAIAAYLAQLARVLDSAELLTRAVAVERTLAHAEKLAAIGELTARIVHEIRNPVAAARSLAQQLCGEPGAPFGEEHAVILAELDRVERQVAELLRFARREELHVEPVDVGEVVRATLATFRPRLEGAGIALDLDLVDGVLARADREKLRQVLVNLVENAIDALAGAADGRRLALAVSTANGHARMRVSDNGPGVAADALPHLFEPFFSTKPHGTGLGLAIVRRTVEAHGGRIAAVPGQGAGLTFAVELPLAERP